MPVAGLERNGIVKRKDVDIAVGRCPWKLQAFKQTMPRDTTEII